ncbi:hypothetical protein RI054_02g09700 [Pseudoscourfieldia marina]
MEDIPPPPPSTDPPSQTPTAVRQRRSRHLRRVGASSTPRRTPKTNPTSPTDLVDRYCSSQVPPTRPRAVGGGRGRGRGRGRGAPRSPPSPESPGPLALVAAETPH